MRDEQCNDLSIDDGSTFQSQHGGMTSTVLVVSGTFPIGDSVFKERCAHGQMIPAVG